jgi:hypothetical protein
VFPPLESRPQRRAGEVLLAQARGEQVDVKSRMGINAPEHVATIEKFGEIDTQFQKLTTAYIAARRSAKAAGLHRPATEILVGCPASRVAEENPAQAGAAADPGNP